MKISNSKTVFTISSSPNINLRAKKNKKGWSLFLDYQYKKSRHYKYLNIYISEIEKRYQTSLDREAIQVAESIKAQFIIDMNSGLMNISSNTSTESDLLIYFKNLLNERRKRFDKSRYKWAGALKYLLEFAPKTLLFEDITTKFLEGYKQFLLAKIAQVTAKDYFSILNSVLNQALREGHISKNPMDLLNRKISRPQTTRIFLTLSEVQILHSTDCVHEPTKRAFLFCCFCGLRYSDVKALKWSQIKGEENIQYLYFTQQKTNSSERMPLAEQAVMEMGKRGADDEFVFDMRNKKITNKHLSDWKTKAKLNKKVTFHVARHTFATLALNIGVELKTVSILLGHKEIRTTEIYAKIMDKTKDEAVAKMPLIKI